MLHVPLTEFKVMCLNKLKHEYYEGLNNNFFLHFPLNSPCLRLNVLSTLLSDNLGHELRVHGSPQSDAM